MPSRDDIKRCGYHSRQTGRVRIGNRLPARSDSRNRRVPGAGDAGRLLFPCLAVLRLTDRIASSARTAPRSLLAVLAALAGVYLLGVTVDVPFTLPIRDQLAAIAFAGAILLACLYESPFSRVMACRP